LARKKDKPTFEPKKRKKRKGRYKKNMGKNFKPYVGQGKISK
jgi:hypothetical protein